MSVQLPIYLDNHATTPCDPEVAQAMLPFLTEVYGNAASRSHSFGWSAREAVETAREQVAALIGGSAKEPGLDQWCHRIQQPRHQRRRQVLGAQQRRARPHHYPADRAQGRFDSCHALERDGWEITWLEVDAGGRISIDALKESIRDNTALVSVMFANNEIGVHSAHRRNRCGL